MKTRFWAVLFYWKYQIKIRPKHLPKEQLHTETKWVKGVETDIFLANIWLKRKQSGDKRGKENRKCWDFLWMWGVCSWQTRLLQFFCTRDSERKKPEKTAWETDNPWIFFFTIKQLHQVEIFFRRNPEDLYFPSKADYCGCLVM